MDINELAKRVQKLEDIEAIKQLKAEYADACDDMYNPKRMKGLFTKDAIWDGEEDGFGKYVGIEEVCKFFDGAKNTLKFGVHYFLQPRIKILSDTEAEGVFYLWQTSTMANGKDIFLTGLEFDKYRKENGKWKMSYMRLKLFYAVDIKEGWKGDKRSGLK
ncbi:MAG: nuclear transport factor 2 family protein, partial [Proteobacteria bacterium]|nr:nuclear transport factor 2 family protein [Pseudomonadota bacterium]